MYLLYLNYNQKKKYSYTKSITKIIKHVSEQTDNQRHQRAQSYESYW